MTIKVEPDILLWIEVVPPAIIPVSDRAKSHIHLDDGVDAIIIMSKPDEFLEGLPDGFVVGLADFRPTIIAVGEINKLH